LYCPVNGGCLLFFQILPVKIPPIPLPHLPKKGRLVGGGCGWTSFWLFQNDKIISAAFSAIISVDAFLVDYKTV